MQVPVQARARAPFGHNGQVRLEYAADEKEYVVVPGRLEYGHFVSKRLRLSVRRILNIQEFDRHRAVVEVSALMHDTERSRADFFIHVDFYLTKWYLP